MTYRLSARIITQAAHTPDRAHTSQRTPAAHSLSLRRVAITNTPEAARAKLSPLPTADLCADNSLASSRGCPSVARGGVYFQFLGWNIRRCRVSVLEPNLSLCYGILHCRETTGSFMFAHQPQCPSLVLSNIFRPRSRGAPSVESRLVASNPCLVPDPRKRGKFRVT